MFLKYLNVSVCATLQFTYVDTYPDDAPVIEVPSYEGMDDSDVENLREFLEQEVICMYLLIQFTSFWEFKRRCTVHNVHGYIKQCLVYLGQDTCFFFALDSRHDLFKSIVGKIGLKFKVPITPKYFFRLNKSFHLFETNCTFLN